jgi:Fe-S-cluster containining protein
MKFDCESLIKCGKCAGDCCGPVPLPLELIKKHADKMQGEVLEKFEMHGEMYIFTKDVSCIFLDRATRRCVIYEDRPNICRMYGVDSRLPCPHMKPNGHERSIASKKKVQRLINRQFKDLGRKLGRRT